MVLDASAAPVDQSVVAVVKAAASMDSTLRFFFDWCSQQNATICPAAHTNQSQTLEETWKLLLDRAGRAPLPAPGCTKYCLHQNVTATDIRLSTQSTLYTPSDARAGWLLPAQAIYEAAFENNAMLFAQPSILAEQSVYNASMTYSQVAIACADRLAIDTQVTTGLKKALIPREFPLMLGHSAELDFIHSCIGWPYPVRNPPHKIDIPRTNPKLSILMVSNLYDPATPDAWTQELYRESRGDRATVVLREFGGRTMYFKAEALDAETVATMNTFMLTLEASESGTVFQS